MMAVGLVILFVMATAGPLEMIRPLPPRRSGAHVRCIPRIRFSVISSHKIPGNIEMESEKLGGILGAIVAAVVLAIAFAYGPMGSFGKPAKQGQTNEAPKAPPVRGPVVREVPQ
jgi:hypothetical protein